MSTDLDEAKLLEDQEQRKLKLEDIENKQKIFQNRENKLNNKIVDIFWSENKFDVETAYIQKSPVGMEFKNWLRNEVESVVTAIKQTEEEKVVKKAQVAHIVLSYDNHNLIKLLKWRGFAISRLDFSTVHKVDDLISEETKKWNEETAPVEAFITFSTEKDKIYASMDGKNTFKRLGVECKFKDTTGPSDIVWENRHMTKA